MSNNEGRTAFIESLNSGPKGRVKSGRGDYKCRSLHVKDTEGNPVIAEEVMPSAERDKQWEKITDVAAKYKACYVFKNKKDYEASRGQRGRKVQRKSLKGA